jgi:hypothetical protein
MRRLGDYATQNLKLTRQQQEAIRNMLEQLEHARSAPP